MFLYAFVVCLGVFVVSFEFFVVFMIIFSSL